MTTALYRLSSNEVIKISLKDQTFSDRDPTFWGVLTDPTTPDGADVRDMVSDPIGPLRVLEFAKIAEPGGNNVRNATQVEIDGFDAPQIDDENQQDADRAADFGDTDPVLRKLVKSILKGIVRENNIMATKYNEFRAAALAATNLNNFQTRVANDTTDAPIRTNQQAFDFIRTDTDKDD